MSTQARQFAHNAITLSNNFGRKGMRTAAGYLRNRNVSLEEALLILCGRA